ncbi:MAG: NTP transferase domain-containing protein, partial [Acidobacteriota bacterium]
MKPSTTNPIPLIVMAGSDPTPAALPEEGAQLHPIQGPKGMSLKIGGRPLIDLLLEPLVSSGCFDPIFIAGPTTEYGPSRQGCEVIDTNSGFGANIRAALQVVAPRARDGIVALTTCDILPTADELRELMEDYFARVPIDFWFPLIIAPNEPDQLGASFWKPR